MRVGTGTDTGTLATEGSMARWLRWQIGQVSGDVVT